MRLEKISFTNFRCFRSEELELGKYTSLVGPNNCGKSTALRALNIFFGGSSKSNAIVDADFHIGAGAKAELSLRFEFSDVAGNAAAELQHYVRNGRLVFEVIASRSEAGQITSRCRGIRYGLPELAPFFAAAKAGDRKPIFDALRERYPGDLPAWQNMAQAEEALRVFETARIEDHVPIPSEENAYGATGPVPILKRYIDWIYVPAVKDVSSEATEQRDSAFSKLILFAVRNRCDFASQLLDIKNGAATALRDVLRSTAAILTEVSGDIDREFKNLTTSPVEVAIDWAEVDEIAIREPMIRSMFKDGSVIGAPEIFGHGLQRTYLMALLALAARTQTENAGFQLLLGIEEPELYQHPPQARFLANALASLADSNAQVIVTTHSPHFINGKTFESIRVLRKRGNSTHVHSWSVDEQRAYCAQRKGVEAIGANAALSGIDRSLRSNVSEIFFAGKVILVEGPEDVALIEAYLQKTNRFSEFLRAGCHIVPVGGKQKMPMLLALARGFSIDTYCIVDLDMNRQKKDQGNGELTKYAADVGDLIDEQPQEEFSGEYFFGWLSNVQSAIENECEAWVQTKTAIADEWGWTLERMDKDPMLLAEAVVRIADSGQDLLPLKRVSDRLAAFWAR